MARVWSFIWCDTTHRGEGGQKLGVKHFHLGWKQQEKGMFHICIPQPDTCSIILDLKQKRVERSYLASHQI